MSEHSRGFLNQLKAAQRKIVEQAEDNLINGSEFKKLLAILSVYRQQPFPGQMFTLIINEAEFGSLDFTLITENLSGAITTKLHTKDVISVNGQFEIENSDNYSPKSDIEAREDYQNLSRDGKIVFLITRDDITYFHEGIEKQVLGQNVWLTGADMKRYYRKKDISEVLDVLDSYRKQLSKIHVYEKFFVPKTTLKRISYSPKRNLLKNKPEKIFQDDLKAFLSEQIAGTFNLSKEVELESKKRLDVNITDSNGDYYFFEIKWLGVSINPTDEESGYSRVPGEMREGVIQCLEYIKELTEEESKVVKLGYLVIFDAREKKESYTLKPFDYLENGLDQYLPVFDLQPGFLIDNSHPR